MIAVSSSSGQMFLPFDRMIRFFLRPDRYRKLSRLSRPISPVIKIPVVRKHGFGVFFVLIIAQHDDIAGNLHFAVAVFVRIRRCAPCTPAAPCPRCPSRFQLLALVEMTGAHSVIPYPLMTLIPISSNFLISSVRSGAPPHTICFSSPPNLSWIGLKNNRLPSIPNKPDEVAEPDAVAQVRVKVFPFGLLPDALIHHFQKQRDHQAQ